MSRLELFFLGPPHIKCDGKPVKLERRKATALVAYLAVTGESHTRDALATLLWPESSQVRARADLRKALLVLRKALGDEWIEVEQESLTLKRNPGFWLDEERFHSLLDGCQTHGHTVDAVCPACLTLLTEAVALYRDDFLAGFSLRNSPAFDEWQHFQSEQLRRALGSALERLARAHSAQGESALAIGYAQRWLALDPLHEPAHCLVMQVCAQAGQRAAALHQYQECVQVLGRELDLSPHEETIRLYRAIRENQELQIAELAPSPIVARLHNLPLQPTPFVGRKDELAAIDERLGNPDCRLLTLVGPGGIGKTRLALQAAAGQVGFFSHGVYFVPLAPLDSATSLAPTIVDTLGLSLHGGSDPKTQLLDHLRRRQMLLLLDNFEHLLDGTDLLVEMLSCAAGVKLLVTSRERLNLRWEWPFDVQGLSFPCGDDVGAMKDYSAVQLFLQSASRSHPGFSLSPEEEAFVAHTCQFLEGLPLGIELAAAWVEAFSCREIAQRIERNLDSLTSSLHDVPARHRSLWAAFDHSWELLSNEEKRTFRRLSVFHNEFRRDAAERVAGASLPHLSALMHKSLLRRGAGGGYEVPQALRQYAEAKLRESEQEWDDTHDLHCACYTEFLQRQQECLRGQTEKKALEDIKGVINDVRTAWQWAVSRRKVKEIARALSTLFLFYEIQSWYHEGEDTMRKVARELGGAAGSVDGNESRENLVLLARALAFQGWFCHEIAPPEEAKKLLQQSLSISRRVGARAVMASSLNTLAVIASESGKYAEARRLQQESLVIYTEIGDRRSMIAGFGNLGLTDWRLEDYVEARKSLQQGLALAEEIGSEWGMASCYSGLGLVAEAVGEYEQARQFYQKSLGFHREIGNQQRIAEGLGNLGFVIYAMGEYEEACRCFHEALETALETHALLEALEAMVGVAALLAEKGEKEQAVEIVTYALHHPANYVGNYARAERLLSELESQLSPQAFAAAQERGKGGNLDELARICQASIP